MTEGTDVLGGVWARERYDWSEPGVVRLTLQDSSDFKPGTVTVYRVTARPDGGCHIDVEFHRSARTIRGRVVGVLVLPRPGAAGSRPNYVTRSIAWRASRPDRGSRVATRP